MASVIVRCDTMIDSCHVECEKAEAAGFKQGRYEREEEGRGGGMRGPEGASGEA